MKGKISLSLRVQQPQDDLEFLKDVLGVEPFRCWKQGDQKSTPQGKLLEGVYDISYCCLRFGYCEQERLCEHIEVFLDQVELHKTSLLSIVNSGGSLELGLFFMESCKLVDVIEWSILKRLSNLQISLGFDLACE